MGFLKWFDRSSDDSAGPKQVAAPSEQFPHAVDAVAALVSRLKEDQWASFQATGVGGDEVVIQVAGETINTCVDEVDLPAIARHAGLNALADMIRPGGKRGDDRTLHRCDGLSVAEVAELVNAIFVHHHRLPDGYAMTGRIEEG